MSQSLDFGSVTPAQLDACDLDVLDFGVIKLNRAGVVVWYNATEAQLSGLSRERVIGRAFFAEIGVCMQNYLVGDRFEEPGDLDEVLDYVFTVKMAPTPVTLRLLRAEGGEFQYLLVKPR